MTQSSSAIGNRIKANSSHVLQSDALAVAAAWAGAKPYGNPTGDCDWAKPVGTFQVKTGPSLGPNPSRSA